MIKRAATVIWWLGALFGALVILMFFGFLFVGRDTSDGITYLAVNAAWVPFAMFAVAYIMGGTFWRPATGPLSRH